jgi:FimV-like protein
MSDEKPPAADVLPPELEHAAALMDRGDLRRARPALVAAAANGTPDVQARARELMARLDPDPRALVAGLAALVLLAWIVGAYVL